MKTVVAVAFVLAAVFVATESESPPDIPFPYENCHRSLRRCTAPLQQNPLLEAVSRHRNLFFEHIDDVCEIVSTAESCVRPEIDSCPDDIQNLIRSAISVGDFLCSDEGKSLLRQFTTSECYDNPIKSFELQGFSELCVAEAAANDQPTGDGEDDRCQIVADSTECIVRETTNLCGDAAGRLIDGVASHISAMFTNHGCTVEATRDLVLRQADVFKRFIEYKKDLELDDYRKRYFAHQTDTDFDDAVVYERRIFG